MAYVTCIVLPEIPAKNTVTMPGLGELTFLRDSIADMPRPSELLLKAMNVMSPALAPVYSFIRVLNVLIAVTDCVKALPKILPFNPQPLIDCFTNLFKALAELIPLIPPIAYVRLLVDIIVLLRLLVDDLLSIVVKLDAEITRIKAIIEKAQNEYDAILLAIGECAQRDIEATTASFAQVFEVIGKSIQVVLNILEIIASLVPGPTEKKIEEWREAIGGLADLTSPAGSVGEFPALQPILTALTQVRTVLLAIESFGKAVLGQAFDLPELGTTQLENP